MIKILAGFYFCVVVFSAEAATTIREDEIVRCPFAEVPTWPDGVDIAIPHKRLNFVYSHQSAPQWLSAEAVRSKIFSAAQAWSACGVKLMIVSETGGLFPSGPQTIRIDWSDSQSLGNFGVADRSNRRLTLGPAAFEMLRSKAPEATEYSLQLVISHEMGHFLGLQRHSRRCIDVMSYYSDDKGSECMSLVPNWKTGYREYRSHLPTACDVQRCKMINQPQ
jgi:hypothetical protein